MQAAIFTKTPSPWRYPFWESSSAATESSRRTYLFGIHKYRNGRNGYLKYTWNVHGWELGVEMEPDVGDSFSGTSRFCMYEMFG